ncbi:uncharacterized protein EDB93DRAFT_1248740 [Suillus bovinus]|uniref:uncharacterized protein n=1 Tax=Suillus bovinus TaxID=48563 RepID=UPI001B86CDD3|nr:uncharacterized protein EDB93DRAFT_1248740 [Suillus bovinus]KAG2153475.1 hypothetical protein EDB93DRAFT_1248740 [Suillus bovinus]
MSHVEPGFNTLHIPCTKPGCNRWFKNKSGLTQHTNTIHSVLSSTAPSHPLQSDQSPSPCFDADINPEQYDGTNLDKEYHAATPGPAQPPAEFFGAGDRLYRNYHPYLTACPCDSEGSFLPPGTPPLLLSDKAFNDWTPYSDRTPLGKVQWQSFSVKYTGDRTVDDTAPWMEDSYDNMLANPDYALEMDLQPYHEFATETDERQWQDFMSGDWAWNHADQISDDLDTHGSTFVPVILGSDKTTVSVATGQNDYYPLYASIGNVRNNVRRAHRNAVSVIGFLAMPKTTKQHAKTADFRNFHHQLFHSSISYILKNLKPAMTKPEVARFGDGHYRCVIYGLGPYIADYEEQVLLGCIVKNWCAKCLSDRKSLDDDSLRRSKTHTEALIEECDHLALWDEFGIAAQLVPFTNDFPRADIHELIAPDLLHQIIKGVFKDHLVVWVEKYLVQTHGQTQADVILDDIDRRIAAVPAFSGLRRFPQGRNFQQWTGDDSKALMKVYLPAIEGYVPVEIVRTFHAFLKFCYLVRRNIITEKTLTEIDDALARFHQYHEIFKSSGMILTFSLPRQHSMKHYHTLIRLFGAPNGLCSSITESKHIKAVKEPWR